MSIYINGLGNVSIQDTIGRNSIVTPISYSDTLIRCIDPIFKDFIPSLQLRRMSTIVRRAVVSALLAVKESQIAIPDAIIAGTGLGCIEDTEKFLTSMIENDETLLYPTNFIQSTHNTLSSQIAIFLKCHSYNNTYTHRGISFEMALWDAFLQFSNNDIHSSLVGGFDEITPDYFIQLKKLDYWKEEVKDSFNITKNTTNGSFAGEGCITFMLSDQPNNSYAELRAMKILYKPKNNREVESFITQFLNENSLTTQDIHVLMLGNSGDAKFDTIYSKIATSLFPKTQWATYKNLCGEFYTASAFGMWSAATTIKNNALLEIQKINKVKQNTISNVLLYNHFQNINHSLILLSSCG